MRWIVTFTLAVAVTAPLLATGLPVATPRIDVMTSAPGAPSIAQHETDRAAVVWASSEEQTVGIYVSQTTLRLGSADDVPRRVGETSVRSQPLVAPTSRGDLVVWLDRDGIRGVSVEPANSLYYPPQPIIKGARPIGLATSNGRTLLIFLSPAGASWNLGGAFLSAIGEVQSTIALGTFRGPVRGALTAAGDGFLLVYAEEEQGELFTLRIDAAAVSNPLQIGTAADTDRIAVAASSNSALIVWPDSVSGNLTARHVDSRGVPVGPSFPTSGGSQPAVSWTGSEFLVTYADPDHDLSGDFISDGGAAVDRRIKIASSIDSETSGALVSDGTTTSVVWLRNPRSVNAAYAGAIEGTAVNRAGDPSSSPTLISHAFTQQDELSAANGGAVSMAAWTEQTGISSRSVYVGRIDALHVAPDGPGLWMGNGTTQRSPSVASNGTVFLVVWIEDSASTRSQIIGQRIGYDGSLVGGRIEISPSEPYIPQVRAIWNGAEFVVIWLPTDVYSNAGVELAKVLETGVVRDRQKVLFEAGPALAPQFDVAAGRRGFLITMQNSRRAGGRPDVYTFAFDESATYLARTLVAENASLPAVGAIEDRYLVVWSDSTGLAGQYLDRTGSPVSSTFSIHPWSASRAPSVISDAAGLLVAADIGGVAHLPILATISGGAALGISLVNEGSTRVDPTVSIIADPSGTRAVFRQFDADWTQAPRIFTNTIPNPGAIDLSVELETPDVVVAGSASEARIRLMNVGTQRATNVGVLFEVDGASVTAVPDGCEIAPTPTQVVCRINALEPGSQFRLQIETVAGSNTTVRVAAYASEQDGALTNNVARASIEVKQPPSRRRPTHR